MRKLSLLFVALLFAVSIASAQAPITTTIADTLYTPVGQPASGKIIVSNPSSFTAADGTVVPQTVLATIVLDSNGAFSQAFVPNANSTPSGTYYIANYILTNGSFIENWIVPSSATPVNLLAVRTATPPSPSIVLPMSQVGAPVNCASLGGAPFWNQTGTSPTDGFWTCSSSFASVSMDLENPQVGDSGVFQWKPKHAVNPTRISCSVDNGNASINLDIRTEAQPNVPGPTILSVPLSCGTTTAVTQVFAVTTIPAETPVALDIASNSGANVVRVHVEF